MPFLFFFLLCVSSHHTNSFRLRCRFLKPQQPETLIWLFQIVKYTAIFSCKRLLPGMRRYKKTSIKIVQRNMSVLLLLFKLYQALSSEMESLLKDVSGGRYRLLGTSYGPSWIKVLCYYHFVLIFFNFHLYRYKNSLFKLTFHVQFILTCVASKSWFNCNVWVLVDAGGSQVKVTQKSKKKINFAFR